MSSKIKLSEQDLNLEKAKELLRLKGYNIENKENHAWFHDMVWNKYKEQINILIDKVDKNNYANTLLKQSISTLALLTYGYKRKEDVKIDSHRVKIAKLAEGLLLLLIEERMQL